MNKRIFGVLIGVIAMAAVASASPMQCSPNGVADVSVAGTTITCGPFMFSSFTVTPSAGSTATISMSAFSLSSWDPATGFADLTFQIGGNLGTDILFGYKVMGPLNGIDLTNPLTSANVTISEAVCLVPFVGGTCSSTPTGLVGNNPLFAGPNGSDHNSFNLTQTAYIQKDIQIGTGGHISDFTESHHTPVPEPMTLSMMGLGLLGLGLMRRRQVKK